LEACSTPRSGGREPYQLKGGGGSDALGPGKDDIDRQLEQISALSAVDDELARMKIEMGSSASSAQIPAHGQPPPADDSPTPGQ
jgi:hypothetical protein